jgi:putative FmdB family regulatory protein
MDPLAGEHASPKPKYHRAIAMPLYDYRCNACGGEFEALVRPPVAPACPACASTDLERLLSGFSFSVRSNGLSKAARKAVQKQQTSQRRDQAAYQEEIEKKHLDDD